MKYFLMLYADEKVGAQIPDADMDKFMGTLNAWTQSLKKADAFVATNSLAPTWDSKTVHVENGDMQVHDGPYAETREQFGGYFVIEAPDIDAAIAWAAKCPAAEWGSIEVRPFGRF
jgi:hypothetical protein